MRIKRTIALVSIVILISLLSGCIYYYRSRSTKISIPASLCQNLSKEKQDLLFWYLCSCGYWQVLSSEKAKEVYATKGQSANDCMQVLFNKNPKANPYSTTDKTMNSSINLNLYKESVGDEYQSELVLDRSELSYIFSEFSFDEKRDSTIDRLNEMSAIIDTVNKSDYDSIKKDLIDRNVVHNNSESDNKYSMCVNETGWFGEYTVSGYINELEKGYIYANVIDDFTKKNLNTNDLHLYPGWSANEKEKFPFSLQVNIDFLSSDENGPDLSKRDVTIEVFFVSSGTGSKKCIQTIKARVLSMQ